MTVVVPSSGNDMSAYVVGADNVHRGPDNLRTRPF